MSRTETALGTPYFSPEGLTLGLQSLQLVIGGMTEKYHGEPLHRPKVIYLPEELSETSFNLTININKREIEKGLLELAIAPQGIELLAILRVPALRTYSILLKQDFSMIQSEKIVISSEEYQNELVSLSKTTSVTLSVYLIVKESSKAKIFFPPPPGTWLAGLGYKLQPPQLSFDFSPEELTLEQADNLKIPMGTFVYVDFLEENASLPLLELTDVKDALTVYINQDIFDSLINSTNHDSRAMLVSTILSAATNQIIFELSNELNQIRTMTFEQLQNSDSVAAKIIDKITPESLDCDFMIEMIRNSPTRALAFADAQLLTARSIKEVM